MTEPELDELPITSPEPVARWRRLVSWGGRVWQGAQPGPAVRTGAAIALGVAAILPLLLIGVFLRPGFGRVLDLFAGPLIALLFGALIAVGVILAIQLAQLLPRFVRWYGVGAIAVLFVILAGLASTVPGLVIAILLAAVDAALGGAVAALITGGFQSWRMVKKIAVVACVVVGVAANLFVLYWLVQRGYTDHLVRAERDRAAVPTLQAPDPSKRGPFKVRTLYYGSGTDRRRPEFGVRAVLRTQSVDATPFVKGTPAWRATVRRWFWGFDFRHFPLNGRVWYPDGKGPFPLVLIVHGNHQMEEFSDRGYAYLARHLATHGFIAVSVDENFMNGSWLGNLTTENDGRGWLLLQHLKAWQRWNEESKGIFAGKVDMGNIALVGHSRGGEAAAIAGAFNRLRYYPDDGKVQLPSGFAIRSIVAIAPSDGQYKPAGLATPLENVNYLTLQGGHDADVSSFAGLRQFSRVRFTDGQYHFKAAVYAYRANHGQFNTVWGDSDYGWPMGWLLNRRALLSGPTQRRFARVYITAFLEATLGGRQEYRELFRDERRARTWLPDDIYVTRFQDSTFTPIATFEEDADLTTATLPGASVEQRGLTLWKERRLPYRGEGSFENGVVYLGWDRDAGTTKPAPKEAARYTIALPPGAAGEAAAAGDGRTLVFALAQTDDKPVDDEAPQAGTERKAGDRTPPGPPKPAPRKDEKPAQVDLTLEAVDASGHVARIPLSAVRRLPPVLKSRFTKWWAESASYGSATETILQTFAVPMSSFAAAAGAEPFDPSAIVRISFVFDRTAKGVVVLDDLGFSNQGLQGTPPA